MTQDPTQDVESRLFRDWQANQQHRSNFIQEHLATRARPHELEVAALNSCRNFALEGFRACYLLNGGAAAAVSALPQAFPDWIDPSFIAWAASAFLIGLLLTMVANVIAYFAENKRAHEMRAEVDFYSASVRKAYKHEIDPDDDPDALWAKSVRHAGKADQLVWATIYLIIAAILSFGAGCVLLLWEPALVHAFA